MIGNGIANADGMSAMDDADARKASDFCKDYVRGNCTRDSCRFLHEVPPKGFLKELFRFCHDFQNKGCFRSNCKFIHCSVEDEERFYATGIIPRDPRNPLCQAYIQGNCINNDCKLVHPPDVVSNDLVPIMNLPPPMFTRPPPPIRDEDSPPEPKYRRYTFDESAIDKQVMPCTSACTNCETLDHKVKLLHDNISVLLKKVKDLTEKNMQLITMNEYLLDQTTSIRSSPCVITSRHGSSAPVTMATVSVTPVVSLAGALPALVPATATSNLALAPAASRAQLLTPAPQILTVSTTQQLVGNSGALIVTSAGAQQLMQVSDSGALMGGGQTVVAVTPAQLTLAPPAQQLISSAPQTAVQQLVQQSALQSQLAPQHQAPQYAAAQHNTTVQHLAAAQQSAQHIAAQQSAQHLAAQQSAQQSAQHLAAQQSAQHLVAQQSAQHLAAAQQSAQQLAAAAQQSAQQIAAQQSAQQMVPSAQQLVRHAQHIAVQQSAQQLAVQQSAQQQLVPSAQQLVHPTSTQQITISSQAQSMALPNSQAQSITFPIISQSILPH